MTLPITCVEINSSTEEESINFIIVDGKIIATSIEEGVTRSFIDNIADKLACASKTDVVAINKRISIYSQYDLDEFNLEELLVEAVNYCTDHVQEFYAMPMDYEYCGVCFNFNEMILLLSNDKHKELSAIILAQE